MKPIILFLIILILMFIAFKPHTETASWYGIDDSTTDRWLTASGMPFDENAMTAASYKYPLGSLVKVTNKANGGSVIVLINDRGPARRFRAKGRVIDLSRGAFKQIADLKTGIINVKVEKIK